MMEIKSIFKCCILGCGKMGEAILKAILSKEVFSADELAVVEADSQTRDRIEKKYQVSVFDDCCRAAWASDIVVLAVKPNVVGAVAQKLGHKLREEQLLISIAAGVTLEQLMIMFGSKRVVRVMPNLAAQISQAASVWTAAADLDELSKNKVLKILCSIGKAVYVDNDNLIDVGTAVSGSGPAYLYLFMEALTDAGVRLGLTRQQATELTLNMVHGAVSLAAESGQSFSDLRYKVTTPGGTTAEAVSCLEKGAFRAVIDEAVNACWEKSRQLSKLN
ncbi:MAG: pyrroline-5-carboxylate reductase [Candidatus Bruticola sp.]